METVKALCFILLLNIQGMAATNCSEAADSENIPHIRMCEDGNVTSDRVILDTHDAAETGETNCSCIVDAISIINIYVEHYGNGLNPNTSECGSEIVAIVNAVIPREGHYQCNTSPEVTLYTRPVTITWSGTPGGDSDYCLIVTGVLLSQYPNATFTITCYKSEATSTSRPTSKSTTTAAKTSKQTTSQITTSTATTSEATNVSTSDQGTPIPGQTTSPPTSSIPGDTSTQLGDSLPLIIMIPAAAGGFILIVIVVIIAVVCCRKNGRFAKGRESYIDDTIDPYGTSHPMSNAAANDDNDEGYGMKDNILYDTFGDILSNGNYSTLQVPQTNSPEVEYAQVKKNLPKTNEEDDQNKIELSRLNGTGNDVYAVVNKSKKDKNAQNSTGTRYTTSEGLVYVKVETEGLKNSEPKPITSDTRQEKDDINEAGHVAYADVVVT